MSTLVTMLAGAKAAWEALPEPLRHEITDGLRALAKRSAQQLINEIQNQLRQPEERVAARQAELTQELARALGGDSVGVRLWDAIRFRPATPDLLHLRRLVRVLNVARLVMRDLNSHVYLAPGLSEENSVLFLQLPYTFATDAAGALMQVPDDVGTLRTTDKWRIAGRRHNEVARNATIAVREISLDQLALVDPLFSGMSPEQAAFILNLASRRPEESRRMVWPTTVGDTLPGIRTVEILGAYDVVTFDAYATWAGARDAEKLRRAPYAQPCKSRYCLAKHQHVDRLTSSIFLARLALDRDYDVEELARSAHPGSA